MSALPRIVAIVGPTASGKTEFTLELAGRLDAEVVSADSMLVYRGLDIGTAKPTREERARVPHHLIDVVDPVQPFSVADWVSLARAALADIRSRGKVALVSGGTPLYFEALFGRYGLAAGAEPNPALRENLRGQARTYGPGYLHLLLGAVDPAAACRIHPSDLKRTVRALEVYLGTGKPLSELERRAGPAAPRVPGETLMVGLFWPREELAARIEARTRAMFDAGLVDEVRRLVLAGVGPETQAMQGVGYREVLAYLAGRASLEETRILVARNTRRLAKRQMTWFGSDPRIRWLRPGMNRKATLEDIVTWAGGKT